MNILAFVTLAVSALSLVGCVAHCPKSDQPDSAFARVSTSAPFTSEKIEGYHVYRATPPAARMEPPVLVLHELPALSARTLDFASRLSAKGFTVYVPRLYGNSSGRTAGMAPLATTLALAASPRWNVVLAQNETSPEVARIRKLCREISRRHNRKIGVIGMCLTGSIPVALMNEECVAAPVVCQPSTPILAFTTKSKRSLGLSQSDIDEAVAAARDRNLELFFTRFVGDSISPVERRGQLALLFSGHFRDKSIGERESAHFEIPKHSHATMTNCAAEPPGRWVFKELTAFLDEKLK